MDVWELIDVWTGEKYKKKYELELFVYRTFFNVVTDPLYLIRIRQKFRGPISLINTFKAIKCTE